MQEIFTETRPRNTIDKINAKPRSYPKSFLRLGKKRDAYFEKLPEMIRQAKTKHRKNVLFNEAYILLGSKHQNLIMDNSVTTRLDIFRLLLSAPEQKASHPDVVRLTAYYWLMGAYLFKEKIHSMRL